AAQGGGGHRGLRHGGGAARDVDALAVPDKVGQVDGVGVGKAAGAPGGGERVLDARTRGQVVDARVLRRAGNVDAHPGGRRDAGRRGGAAGGGSPGGNGRLGGGRRCRRRRAGGRVRRGQALQHTLQVRVGLT